MDIAKARCGACGQAMEIVRVRCAPCEIVMDGRFEVSGLGRLSPENQAFVAAFLRHHGSLKRMEDLFDISYPTVKNRLNAINQELDASYQVPSPNSAVLDQLARGDITVDEALDRLA